MLSSIGIDKKWLRKLAELIYKSQNNLKKKIKRELDSWWCRESSLLLRENEADMYESSTCTVLNVPYTKSINVPQQNYVSLPVKV